ncbi:unnamed protein product [Rotaria sordida]|uniref:Uncharacterized protein n=1 Tax=Rotaria sordida TaxID=392033 RepID=A0A815NLQ2_9BILA|nr:unnamed protein product [Rotaria sordida]
MTLKLSKLISSDYTLNSDKIFHICSRYSEITKATRNNASFYIIDSIPTISIKASSSSSLSSLSKPVPLQDLSSLRFLKYQKQQILNINRQRQTSLNEYISSLFYHNSNEDKTINDIIIKDSLSKTNIRKSSKKCSSSLDDNAKSTNEKLSSATISTNNRK